MSTRVRITAPEEVVRKVSGRRATERSSFPMGRAALLLAAALALGQMQAVVGVYLRQVAGLMPPPESFTPKLLAAAPGWVIAVEQTREVAGYVALLCVGLLAGRSGRERAGAVLLAAGVATLARYVGLYLTVGWPGGLKALDVVTTIPRPVAAPVWWVLVAGVVCAGIGAVVLRRR